MSYNDYLELDSRISRLERCMVRLCWALARQGTEQDGSYGFLPYGKILGEIVAEYPDICDP